MVDVVPHLAWAALFEAGENHAVVLCLRVVAADQFDLDRDGGQMIERSEVHL